MSEVENAAWPGAFHGGTGWVAEDVLVCADERAGVPVGEGVEVVLVGDVVGAVGGKPGVEDGGRVAHVVLTQEMETEVGVGAVEVWDGVPVGGGQDATRGESAEGAWMQSSA